MQSLVGRYGIRGETSLVPDLTASDVRQWFYCPRIPYYRFSMPRARPVTYKMDEGKLQHQRIEELERRRTLRSYGLRLEEKAGEVERHYRARLSCDRLGVSGIIDLVLLTPREAIPVEYKHTESGLGLNHKYQLVTYALLVEERWRRPVRRAFVHFIPMDRLQEVPITPNGRTFVRGALGAIRRAVREERVPPPTPRRGRCGNCEYLRFCGDVEVSHVLPE